MAQSAERVGVINVPGIIVNSTAYQTAQTQRQTTYAAQLQQARARSRSAETEPTRGEDRRFEPVGDGALFGRPRQWLPLDELRPGFSGAEIRWNVTSALFRWGLGAQRSCAQCLAAGSGWFP